MFWRTGRGRDQSSSTTPASSSAAAFDDDAKSSDDFFLAILSSSIRPKSVGTSCLCSNGLVLLFVVGGPSIHRPCTDHYHVLPPSWGKIEEQRRRRGSYKLLKFMCVTTFPDVDAATIQHFRSRP
jgi:hypothetical protein